MKKTRHEHDQRKMTPPFCWFPLLEKRSKEVIPFTQLVMGSQSFNFFCRLHANYFVAELKIVYVADITVL